MDFGEVMGGQCEGRGALLSVLHLCVCVWLYKLADKVLFAKCTERKCVSLSLVAAGVFHSEELNIRNLISRRRGALPEREGM